MAVKTRSVVLWYNASQERLALAVNPKNLVLFRTQETKAFRTISGEALQISQGSGLSGVSFSTFLPGEGSRFFNGVAPRTALAMLQRWQTSRRAVRLMISDTDINGLFLLTRLEETLTEGDPDVGIRLELQEARSPVLTAVTTVTPATGLNPRPIPLRRATPSGTSPCGITAVEVPGASWRRRTAFPIPGSCRSGRC